MGWMTWLNQLFWPVVIFLVLYLLIRPGTNPSGASVFFTAARRHFGRLAQHPLKFLKLSLLSVLAFGLEDVTAYTLAMAFTAENVILAVRFDLLLLGFVGTYVARLIQLTPGGLGLNEWGFAMALYFGGVGLPEAATIAILFYFFRYVAFLIPFGMLPLWRGVKTNFRAVLELVYNPEPDEETTTTETAIETEDLLQLPGVPVPHMPTPQHLWCRMLNIACILLGLFFLDRLTVLLADFWLLQRLDLQRIFWTNFNMGIALFIIAFLCFAGGIATPAFVHPVSRVVRRFVVQSAVAVGLVAGYLLSMQYLDYLIFAGGRFGEVDPVFSHDIGFYTFSLPALWTTWTAAIWCALLMLISSVACAYAACGGNNVPESAVRNRLAAIIGVLSTPCTLFMVGGVGLLTAIGVWLTRFNLLLKDNSASAVHNGAEYVDVTGLFSTLNQIYVTATVILGVTVVMIYLFRILHQAVVPAQIPTWSAQMRKLGYIALVLIAFDFVFTGIVALRDVILVGPNEPVIQLAYIRHHIDATRTAYGLKDIEVVELVPKGSEDSLPDVEKLLASPTLRNAPLWPTYVSYLERLIDSQHAQRILQTKGDNMVYGPMLEILQQQQKLRTYYDFLSVDPVRYTVQDEKRIFASAVREIPLLNPEPWLAWWGQRFMLFTHGHGLVMAPVAEVNAEGEPVYISGEIPVQTKWEEVSATHPQIYYGEGAETMAFSNVREMKEFDYPTEQGRAENILPTDVPAGVQIDSPLKRIVFGWRSGQFFDMVFSHLINDDTRVHYFRTPIERLERVAPFLYYDTNPYAVVADGEILWMVNAVTTSDRYPYSKREFIGDKSDERSPFPRPPRRLNYTEDSVKATVNAYTGQIRFYKISDAPVIKAWANVYPDLFINEDQMPDAVRRHLTYPVHLFHVQFDDVYNIYHMDEPMYFFNMEDMWDDGDEVLGPILDHGRAITFSIEPYICMLETGGVLPTSAEGTQFSLVAVFTPENALNLRAIPIAYQDGADYGRLVVLQIPKGHYILGPEQADAALDQHPDISQQIAWWNRQGNEVIRGHTTLLLVDGEVLYVEPIFIRSQQNPVTQLKRVVVIFRGQPYMARTLEEAIRGIFQNR